MFVEAFSNFFMSPMGAITGVVILGLLVTVFLLNLNRRKILSAKTLTYSAVAMALATVLSNFKLFDMPYGGTVTACSMIFVSLIGYWFGIIPGMIASISYGILQLIIDPYVVHPMQLLLDYPLAFGMLGLSGLFCNSKYGLYKGYIIGTAGRWFFSTLSGIIFFYEYAGDQNVFIYSAGYNMSYILPEMVITIILISVPAFRYAIEHVRNSTESREKAEKIAF